ncbi:ABC transporter permease [Mesorhizobium sp. LHD-90]|uniref:ABC transporter permease n=1 Tax=Mesorhizobium sp. LHD-90 TaxID=3071414 RepID=UPI0027E0D805|nr:ABC transporter permease [Mesorhizobium sp. LHD-90]MDQ6437202.1 ABC transporter permease [Mesorhizobium sp. LHD-90]
MTVGPSSGNLPPETTGQAEAGAGPASGRLSFFFAVLRARPDFALGYGIVLAVVLLAIFAPWIAPFDPEQANPIAFLQPPGWPHLMGTDATGLDIFSRVIYAPRIDLAIALAGTLVSAVVGSILGAAAGYYETRRGLGTFLSGFIMRSSDVLQAFPVFVFAIAVVAVLGQSLHSIVLAVAFVNTPIYLRLMRSQVLSVRRLRYVEAAYIAGVSDLTILTRHVIPNAIAPVLAQLSVNIGWAILLTSALSFIGAGVEAPTPEWGSMIAMGYQNIITGHWWPSIFPGLALAVTIFGFSLIGSSVEVLADPVRRRRLAGQIQRRGKRKSAQADAG